MTDRAKRAAEVLLSFGWDLDGTYPGRMCGYCGANAEADANFCGQCGNRLPYNFGNDSILQIEAAIAAAVDHD
jgi:predicted amidophosphoribosyltransferase